MRSNQTNRRKFPTNFGHLMNISWEVGRSIRWTSNGDSARLTAQCRSMRQPIRCVRTLKQQRRPTS